MVEKPLGLQPLLERNPNVTILMGNIPVKPLITENALFWIDKITGLTICEEKDGPLKEWAEKHGIPQSPVRSEGVRKKGKKVEGPKPMTKSKVITDSDGTVHVYRQRPFETTGTCPIRPNATSGSQSNKVQESMGTGKGGSTEADLTSDNVTLPPASTHETLNSDIEGKQLNENDAVVPLDIMDAQLSPTMVESPPSPSMLNRINAMWSSNPEGNSTDPGNAGDTTRRQEGDPVRNASPPEARETHDTGN